jgi:ABC-type uncharacterized transport system ATPase component
MELEISGINKNYEGVDGEPDFSLEIPSMSFEVGKVIFLMGHNGSGKSIFIKLMAGEMMPSTNFVEFTLDKNRWKAHEIPSAIVRQKAEESLAIELTVRENLLLRIKTKSLLDKIFPSSHFSHRVKSLVKSHIELLKKLDQPCRNLSGGQRQTLAFLAVASENRYVLFLDEFLSATDHHTSQLLRDLAKDYAKNIPACVFIVSHDINVALQDADRILILRSGRLIKDIVRNTSEPDWNMESISSYLNNNL